MELLVIILMIVLPLCVVLPVYLKKRKKRNLMEKYGDEKIVAAIMENSVWQGMTESMLLDARGRPDELDRSVMKNKTKATLKYGRTGKNRFKNRIFIENGVVVGWN